MKTNLGQLIRSQSAKTLFRESFGSLLRGLALLLTALSTTHISAFAAPSSVTTGESAPSFSLPGIDGKMYRLDDFKGQVVVLEWFNSGCPFVVKHYQSDNMQGLHREYAKDLAGDTRAKAEDKDDQKVVWLTIISSAPGKQGHGRPKEHRETMAKWHMQPSAFLIDEDGEVGKRFGAKTTPHMFIINRDGVLVYQGAIDSIPSTRPSDIPESKNYVREALSEVFAGRPVTTATTPPYGCSVKYKD